MKALTFFFALMAPAFGRMGETVGECRGRYGKEIKVEESISGMGFFKAGYMILAYFDEGRVGMLNIFHPSVDQISGSRPVITEEEIDTFLKENGSGSEWVEREDFDPVNRTWDSKDGKKLAIYDTMKHKLVIATLEYRAKMDAKRAAEEKRKFDGV